MENSAPVSTTATANQRVIAGKMLEKSECSLKLERKFFALEFERGEFSTRTFFAMKLSNGEFYTGELLGGH